MHEDIKEAMESPTCRCTKKEMQCSDCKKDKCKCEKAVKECKVDCVKNVFDTKSYTFTPETMDAWQLIRAS